MWYTVSYRVHHGKFEEIEAWYKLWCLLSGIFISSGKQRFFGYSGYCRPQKKIWTHELSPALLSYLILISNCYGEHRWQFSAQCLAQCQWFRVTLTVWQFVINVLRCLLRAYITSSIRQRRFLFRWRQGWRSVIYTDSPCDLVHLLRRVLTSKMPRGTSALSWLF